MAYFMLSMLMVSSALVVSAAPQDFDINSIGNAGSPFLVKGQGLSVPQGQLVLNGGSLLRQNAGLSECFIEFLV